VSGASRSTPGPGRSWSLRRRLGAVAAAVGVLLLVVVGSSVLQLVQLREHQERLTQDYYDAISLSQQQFIWMVDAETSVRGYALTRDPASLEPLDVGDRNQRATQRIERSLAGDEDTLAALDRAQASASRWFTEWAQPTIEGVGAGDPVTAQDVTDGKVLFDQVRADFSAYLGELREQRLAATEELEASTERLFGAVLLSALVAGASALALWLALRRWVLRPVRDLAAETRLVGDGDLAHPVDGSGPRELLALAADVEAMRRRLVAQVEAAETSSRELDAAHRRLEQRSEDLARSNRDLEQFAYVASHDLQEPLRKVASFCQLLQKRYGGELDDRADQYIEFAVDGAKRMQQLINDLLVFSRVGRSGPAGEGPEGQADLGECLRRALVALETAVEEAGAQVTADPLPVVPGQAGLLTQLLQNLVANAVKFRAPGRPPRVHVGARRSPDGECWELSVTDNGIGIEPQYAERVFVIFQRLHAKEEYGGTGIGLALCKRIVEHHGGAIWLEPADVGTTVRWTLPATTAVTPAPAGAAAGPAGSTAVPASRTALTAGRTDVDA